ncbi:MAG: hypothetical protein ACREFP_16860 [Acetobacteraceae bacterium]
MGLSFWFRLAVTGAVGVVALLKASASESETASVISFLIFLAAIVYGFWLIKSAFDRTDRGRR